ncbi:MAG: DUF3299 domain-containing protein [Pseudomonadota bacterium]
MKNATWKVLATAATVLAISGLALAKDVRELSWDDLLPPVPALTPDRLLRGGNVDPTAEEDDLWDMEVESFEDVFATHAYPIGVVEDLDGQQVKLPGFLVPLELIDDGTVKEFLLVPSFGACVHYPAPPPNQIVYVVMDTPIVIKSMWDPVWVSGEIRTESQETDLASASYSMTGELVEEYEY